MHTTKKDKIKDGAHAAETSFALYAKPLITEAIEQAVALRSSPDAEVPYKLRLGLLRLSTLLWTYQPILSQDFGTEQHAVCRFLARAAHNNRDWDILISLLEELNDDDMFTQLRALREHAFMKNQKSLSNANFMSHLRDKVAEANNELDVARRVTSRRPFTAHWVIVARRQFRRNTTRALPAKRSDHAPRQAKRRLEKNARYPSNVLQLVPEEHTHKNVIKLKRHQKRFGTLNDLAANLELLLISPDTATTEKPYKRALRTLKESTPSRCSSRKITLKCFR